MYVLRQSVVYNCMGWSKKPSYVIRACLCNAGNTTHCLLISLVVVVDILLHTLYEVIHACLSPVI